MLASPIPTPLAQLAHRRFLFYPPIAQVECNEWRYLRATWSDIFVVNVKSGAELWIPRCWVGEVSLIEDPIPIVGLLRELEYRDSVVSPHRRRVIEMPAAMSAESNLPIRRRERKAAVVAISLRSRSAFDGGRTIIAVVVLSVIACLTLAGAVRNFIIDWLHTF